METTLTTAGQLADAGVARLRAAAPLASYRTGAAPCALHGAIAPHQVTGQPSLTWTTDALVEPTTSMVFDRKNRPARQLSELSP